MIRGAGGRPQELHLIHHKFFETLGVEQCSGLLKEEGLVRGSPSFGDEEEFVFITRGGVEIDLGGEIGAGVFLFKHRERRTLRVAEVFFGVAVVYSARDGFGVVTTGPDLLSFLAHHDGGSGILAEGKNAFGGDFRVFQQGGRDVAIVVGGFVVGEDGGDLLEVFGPEGKRTVSKRVGREKSECFGRDFEDCFPIEFGGADPLGG